MTAPGQGMASRVPFQPVCEPQGHRVDCVVNERAAGGILTLIPKSGVPASAAGSARHCHSATSLFPARQRGGLSGCWTQQLRTRSRQRREGGCRAHGSDASGNPTEQGAPAEPVEAWRSLSKFGPASHFQCAFPPIMQPEGRIGTALNSQFPSRGRQTRHGEILQAVARDQRHPRTVPGASCGVLCRPRRLPTVSSEAQPRFTSLTGRAASFMSPGLFLLKG